MLASLFVVAALSAAPEAQPNPEVKPKVEAAELHAIEKRILQETNRVRRRHGLRPLRLDGGLLSSARRHTSWMTRRRSLQHTSAPVAENIAMGQHTAPQVLNDWMNSPGHRANILNASYTKIGVSAYQTNSGTVYWCQQFD
ncbi:MAG: CAP domain-containing protein [Planctomycetia bacterium]|nr:CAP domain-containing protein [Planctomycetia bacterium]